MYIFVHVHRLVVHVYVCDCMCRLAHVFHMCMFYMYEDVCVCMSVHVNRCVYMSVSVHVCVCMYLCMSVYLCINACI